MNKSPLYIFAAGAVCLACACLPIGGTNHQHRIETLADSLMQVGMPPDVTSQVKDYEGFTLSFNSDNGTPNWVAWELLGSETSGEHSRKDYKFWQDYDVDGCTHYNDYKNSGYDRGHMCPAADMKWSMDAMNDCFSMANITPQAHALNSGAWGTLENKARLWAQRDSAIIVIAGPLYSPHDNRYIADGKIRVPGAYYKVLLAPYVERPRAIAFVYPNEHCPGNMQNYAMSVDMLEQLTGFDFFAALPDSVENAVEASFSFRDWNRRSQSGK